jgi:argininosuccinate lyase
VLSALHNTPFGDIVDSEDDLQPLVAVLFKDATRAVRLVAAVIAGAEFDVARMRARAAGGWVTLTELADTLVREHDLPFSAAHAVAGRLVAAAASRPGTTLSDVLAAVARQTIDRDIRISDDRLSEILSPEHFVAVRTTLGGPAPERVTEAIEEARGHLAGDEAVLSRMHGGLAGAHAALKRAAGGLV